MPEETVARVLRPEGSIIGVFGRTALLFGLVEDLRNTLTADLARTILVRRPTGGLEEIAEAADRRLGSSHNVRCHLAKPQRAVMVDADLVGVD